MRIVQVNVIYGHGSTGRIVETLHQQYLKLGHDSYVLFGRGKRPDDKRVIRTGFLWEAKLWRLIQLFTGNTLNGSPLSTWNLKRHIKRLNPDVVHVQLINGNMCNVVSFLKWLRKKKYKVVLTHHAKFLFAGGCGINLCDGYTHGCGKCPLKRKEFGRFCLDRSSKNYKRLAGIGFPGWKEARHTFVSPWLMSLAKKSKSIAGAEMTSIFNPVDTEVFRSDVADSSPIDGEYLFFPSSMVGADTKGANYIDEIAQRVEPLGLKLVITENSRDAVRPKNVIDVGRINGPQEMARYYRHAKATLVLSLFETFSMSTIESILCGTPVVGFECGGPSSLDTGGMATFVPYGDLEMLLSVIRRQHPTLSTQFATCYQPVNVATLFLNCFEHKIPIFGEKNA